LPPATSSDGTQTVASQMMSAPKASCSSTVRAMKFCDTEAAFWQMALQHSQLHNAHSGSSHPHLGAVPALPLQKARPLIGSSVHDDASEHHKELMVICVPYALRNWCWPCAGRIGGLKGHRWLLMAIDAKVTLHVLSRNAHLAPASRPLCR